MTKQQLIDAVVAKLAENYEGKAPISKKVAGEAIDAAFEQVADAIVAEGKFLMPGFGTFQVKERAARQGRNPQTQEPIQIAASKSIAFKQATGLKARLNPAEEAPAAAAADKKVETKAPAKKAATKAPKAGKKA